MRLLFLLCCINFQATISGQNISPGQYKSQANFRDSLSAWSTLTLNCDKTFISNDDAITAFGKWHRSNHNLLILIIDSSRNGNKLHLEKTKITLKLKGDRLYWRDITKNESRKINNQLSRATGEQAIFENYLERNKSIYFIKASAFKCD